MKREKIRTAIIMITIEAIAVGIYAYNTSYTKVDKEIKVMDCKEPEVANEKGYKISKCKADNISLWLDKNRVITIKSDGRCEQAEDLPIGYISIYDLDSKTYENYESTNVYRYEEKLKSPSGKYILYKEPRKLADNNSEEYKDLELPEEINNIKVNILNLETGKIIEDFDKDLSSHVTNYKWINDDYIFIQVNSKWRIVSKDGKIIKEGELDLGDNSDNASLFTNISDVSEIKEVDNDLSGIFYYREYKSNDENEIYSMDINTKEEKLVGKYENCKYVEKKDEVIVLEGCNTIKDNQGGEKGCGFKLINLDGREIQTCLTKGRAYSELTISNNKEKCAFLDFDMERDSRKQLLDVPVKVLDVKSGEVKEIAKVRNLIDGGDDMETAEGFEKLSYDMVWDSTGSSLAFNCSYISNKDGDFHKSSYIISLDK